MSGYVIAASYDARLAEGLPVRRFLRLRLARLYPLFLLMCLVGFAIMLAVLRGKGEAPDLPRMAAVLAMNALALPAVVLPEGWVSAFPYNGPAWSIFFEIWVNVAFVAAWPLLGRRALLWIVAAAGAALAAIALGQGTLNVGWSRGDLVLGVPRVVFSFFLGVLIFRHAGQGARLGGAAAGAAMAGLVGLLGLVLAAEHLLPPLGGALDLAAVLVIFPLMLLAAVRLELPPRLAKAGALVGGISYAAYSVHVPMMTFLGDRLPAVFGEGAKALAPLPGLLLLAAALPLCWLLWRRFELPAQALLRGGRRERRGAALEPRALPERG